jgi:hypothetical protein
MQSEIKPNPTFGVLSSRKLEMKTKIISNKILQKECIILGMHYIIQNILHHLNGEVCGRYLIVESRPNKTGKQAKISWRISNPMVIPNIFLENTSDKLINIKKQLNI